MSDYSFDGTVLGQHATVSDPVSGDQTWEKVVSKNLGLDLNMFNNRLSLTTDFYIRDTKGILGKGKSLPSIYGATPTTCVRRVMNWCWVGAIRSS